MTIQYLKGDATAPKTQGKKIIVHVCNDIGKWGKGFVLAISKRWKEPEQVYKHSFSDVPKPVLGNVQFIRLSDSIIIANIIGQHGICSPRNKTALAPIRYDAVFDGLHQVMDCAIKFDASVHMPRIGCGLAGGTWENIEPLINASLIEKGVDVFVYDF